MTAPRRICDGCGKRINEGEASLTMNTETTSAHWHLRCCPLIKEEAPARKRC